jgi:hypothetical protein
MHNEHGAISSTWRYKYATLRVYARLSRN